MNINFFKSLYSKKKRFYKRIVALITLILPFGFFIAIYRSCQDGIPVLNYHQINDEDINLLTVPVATFREQMDYLKENGYQTITPDQLHDYIVNGYDLPQKPILITFDDGYEDNYHNAYPILKEKNMQATIFLITDYVEKYDNYLNWEQITEMSENGFYFGSHTLNHQQLVPPISEDEIYRQLYESKEIIEWRTLSWCQYIAFPCGKFDDKTLELAIKAGYKGGFTVRYDLAKEEDNPFDINRVPVFGHANSSNDMLRFKLRLHFAPLFGRLERLQAWLYTNGYSTIAKRIPLP